MKRTILLLSALAIVSATAYGSIVDNIYGKVNFAKGEYSISGENIDEDFNSGMGYSIGVELSKDITPNIEVGLGLSYEDNGTMASFTPYKAMPLYFSGKYTFNTEKEYNPYVKAYLGYSFNNETDNLEMAFENIKVDDGLYYGVGAGIEINNFNFELAYVVTEADVKEDTVITKIDADFSRVQFGFGYKF